MLVSRRSLYISIKVSFEMPEIDPAIKSDKSEK